MGIRQFVEYSISDIFVVICFGFFLKRRCRWNYTAGLLTLQGLVMVALEFMRMWLYGQGSANRYTILLAVVAGMGIGFHLSEYRDSRTTFTILMAACYGACGDMVAKIGNSMGIALGWVVIIEILVHLVLLFLMVRFLLPSIRKLQQVYRREWRLFSMVLGMLLSCMFLLYACLKRSDVTVFHNVVPLFYLLCVYLMVTLALRLLVQVNEDEIEASQQKILDASMKVMKREMTHVRHTSVKISAYNHDSRHFVRMLAGMMAEGDYKGAQAALMHLPDISTILSTVRYCENLPINGALSCYASMARERQIIMNIQADTPESIGEHDWELAVVFETLLEQAIELCSAVKKWEQRKLHVRIVRTGRQTLFEIRNTVAVPVVFDRDTGLPALEYLERHGFDMRSVRLFAQRLKGTLECGMEDGWYFVKMVV